MPTISCNCAMHRRIAKHAARMAIREWLRGLTRAGMYRFELDGVECALEFFRGHWDDLPPYGIAEGGRWRWGRVDAGDPDDDLSGENVLLDIALGRKLLPEPPLAARLRLDFPVLPEGADLTREQLRTQTAVRARENLCKIVLHLLPPA